MDVCQGAGVAGRIGGAPGPTRGQGRRRVDPAGHCGGKAAAGQRVQGKGTDLGLICSGSYCPNFQTTALRAFRRS